MALISFWERMRIPAYDSAEQCSMAAVEIDHDKCNCCGLCTKACPASVLYIEGSGKERKLAVNPHLPQCVACNDCTSICDRGAIKAVKTYDFLYRYKTVLREGLEAPRTFRS
jgi:formate hydrogenlyase subunit 6/NADH:ubiquinone oxidoreductase subunit I